MAITQLPAPLDIPANQPFNKDVLDAAFAYIVQRFLLIEAFKPNFEDAVNQLNEFGLARLNQAIQPIYDELVTISNLGVIFTANSNSSVVAQTGNAVFTVSGIDTNRFAPAAYLAAQASANSDTILTGKLKSYDRTTGQLVITVDQVGGTTGGTYSSWVISPTATPNLLATAHSVGAYTMAETDGAIATLGSTLVGGAPSGRQSLKTVNDAVVAAQSSLTGFLAGGDGTVSSLGTILSRFIADEGLIASLLTQVGNRLRVDAAQGLTPGQISTALGNLGGASGIQQSVGVYPSFALYGSAAINDVPNGSYNSAVTLNFQATAPSIFAVGSGFFANNDSRPVDIIGRLQLADTTNNATVALAGSSVITLTTYNYGSSGLVVPVLGYTGLTVGRTYRLTFDISKGQAVGPTPGTLALSGIVA